ncbi:hypothetical protein [Streptomyces jeddahensis]|uniref:Telomeric repeat-binding factor 2 n=1 Tax=Streptomyces jeddahensis TaxID=1716141 RepID=A0A177HT04_9ACTN|nr:hypothetical protein [Streptomyces jeddahensis]OAH13800.1 hypothetical protein STSP_27780 [Streptomyces jeddahensis]
MSIRHARRLRRAAASTLVAAALAFTATACGGGDDGGTKATSTSSASQDTGKSGNSGSGNTVPDTSKTIATLKGDKGIDMVIHEAKRDSGGFVTVSGEFKNTSQDTYTIPVQWNGLEKDVAAAGNSLAGMTLVDSKEKKRYYVLRDTDNRPLTTTGYDPSIDAGEGMTFFAQFPAPPESTTSVDLQFPGFPNATIEIS